MVNLRWAGIKMAILTGTPHVTEPVSSISNIWASSGAIFCPKDLRAFGIDRILRTGILSSVLVELSLRLWPSGDAYPGN